MTNLDIVRDEIEKLERQEINYQIAEKLAWLYIVKDHMTDATIPIVQMAPVEAVSTPPEESINIDSEFMAAVKKVDSNTAWAIMDEAMETLKVLHPKLYMSILYKLEEKGAV